MRRTVSLSADTLVGDNVNWQEAKLVLAEVNKVIRDCGSPQCRKSMVKCFT